jgi:MoxR-like ATPase
MPATATATATATPAPAFDAATLDAIDLAQQLREQMGAAFVERDDETLLMLLAYIAREHVLLLGPHGTGKSLITRTFADALDVPRDSFWKLLFGKFTLPDEVFGPLDVNAYKAGVNRRVTTRKLPEAQVAFGDEIFKAGDSILNALLTLLNEREFENPTPAPCPLELFVGCSNELPEGGAHGPLAPLYDRFLFRRWTSYIGDESKLINLMLTPRYAPRVTVKLTAADTALLRAAAEQVRLDGPTGMTGPDGAAWHLMDVVVRKLKAELEADGIVVSDRRWMKAMKAVQAHAVLHGRSTAILADLAPLAHCLWDEPADAERVGHAVLRIADADAAAARRKLAACVQAMQALPKDGTISEFAEAGARANRDIKQMLADMQKLAPSPAVSECIAKAEKMLEAIWQEQQRRFQLG